MEEKRYDILIPVGIDKKRADFLVKEIWNKIELKTILIEV